MKRLREWWRGFVARNLVAQGAENDYYAWADQRLDEIAEQRRAVRHEHDEPCRDPVCPIDHPPALHETHTCRDCGAVITVPYAKPPRTL